MFSLLVGGSDGVVLFDLEGSALFCFWVLRRRLGESVMLAPISLVGAAGRATGCDPRCFPSICGFLVQVNYLWGPSRGICKIVALWIGFLGGGTAHAGLDPVAGSCFALELV